MEILLLQYDPVLCNRSKEIFLMELWTIRDDFGELEYSGSLSQDDIAMYQGLI